MKPLLLFTLCSIAAFAADPKPGEPKQFVRSSITLDVKSMTVRRSTTNDYKTDWGSYDKTHVRQRDIAVDIQNFGTPFDGSYQVFWLGREATGKGGRILIDASDLIPLKLAPRKKESKPFTSPEIVATDLNLKAIQERYRDGFKLDSWLVVIWDGASQKPTAVKASSPAIEEEFKQGKLDEVGVKPIPNEVLDALK